MAKAVTKGFPKPFRIRCIRQLQVVRHHFIVAARCTSCSQDKNVSLIQWQDDHHSRCPAVPFRQLFQFGYGADKPTFEQNLRIRSRCGAHMFDYGSRKGAAREYKILARSGRGNCPSMVSQKVCGVLRDGTCWRITDSTRDVCASVWALRNFLKVAIWTH